MTDPNQGDSVEVLEQRKLASYERFRIEIFNTVEKLLEDFEMTWKDLAEKLNWSFGTGEDIKEFVGGDQLFTLADLNDIAHVFSAEPYIIFRPRKPWTVS